jgi:putative FmdB family regulatory protein
MPIYGYACKECGHTLDALQKMSDEPLVECPECHKPALKRQLSAPRFRLAGKGWYETDFKSDNQRNIAGEKEPAKADGKEGKDGKGGDTKPDKAAKSDKPAEKAAAKPAAGGKSDTKSGSGDKSSAA